LVVNSRKNNGSVAQATRRILNGSVGGKIRIIGTPLDVEVTHGNKPGRVWVGSIREVVFPNFLRLAFTGNRRVIDDINGKGIARGIAIRVKCAETENERYTNVLTRCDVIQVAKNFKRVLAVCRAAAANYLQRNSKDDLTGPVLAHRQRFTAIGIRRDG